VDWVNILQRFTGGLRTYDNLLQPGNLIGQIFNRPTARAVQASTRALLVDLIAPRRIAHVHKFVVNTGDCVLYAFGIPHHPILRARR
jgi:hypothetical protein